MSCCNPRCPSETIVDPPVRVVRNVFHPQLIRVVHPIEIVTREHCVPFFKHVCVFKHVSEEACDVNTRSTPKPRSEKKSRISRAKSRSKSKK